MTPAMPAPWALRARRTCTGLAVAQKMRQTSGQAFMRSSTLMGYAPGPISR